MTTCAALVLCIPLALAAFAARAEVVDIAWTADGRHAQRRDIPAGKFVELCSKLPAGAKVQWSFDATGPTDFNIHYHQGKDVVYPARLTQAARAQETLITTVEQDYCWMWANKTTSTVVLNVSLTR